MVPAPLSGYTDVLALSYFTLNFLELFKAFCISVFLVLLVFTKGISHTERKFLN